MEAESRKLLLLCLCCFVFLATSGAQPHIGVNYGEVADNLPPPDATAKLLKSTAITKVRLYGVDAGLIRALAGTGVSLVLGVANGDIPAIAADPNAASGWLAANVLPFVPASSISVVAVGNEVLERGGDGGAAADGHGLRVLAGGRGLRRHPARGRVLRAQHGARPRRLRHEPALPGRRQPPMELRLPAVRHPHLHQPQLRLVCLHRRPMMQCNSTQKILPAVMVR